MDPLKCLEIETAESPINSIENSFPMSQQHLSEFPKSGKPKSDKCNLRKSLAWDSAFFTSAGVLDSDELSSMMEGVRINDDHSLSTIPEDLRVSGESISTLASDCLDLEDDTDADIFRDVRASIQKSSRPPKTTNSVIQPCPFSNDLDQDDHDCGAKKMDAFSTNKGKAKAGSKASNCKGASRKTTKESPIQPVPRQPVCNKGRASPFPKPIKQLTNSLSISSTQTTRTITSATNNDKVGNVASGKGPQVSRIPCSSISSKPDTRGKFLSKSFLGYSLTKSEPTTSCSSNECSEVPKSIKLSSNSQGKRMGDKSACVPPPPVSISKPPSTKSARLKYKSQPGASNLGNFSKSTISNIQNVSPASSISEWSCESSSSSTVTQKPNRGGGATSLPGRITSISFDTSQVSDAFKSHNNQPSHLTSTRPSGLRMPSPKIGFFDGVKTTGYTTLNGNIKPPTGKILATTTTSLSKNSYTAGRNPSGDSTKGSLIKPKRGDILKLQKTITSSVASKSPKDVRHHTIPEVADVLSSLPLKNEENLTHSPDEKHSVGQVPLVNETVFANIMDVHNEVCGNQLKVDPLMLGPNMYESSSVNDTEDIKKCQKVYHDEIGSQSPAKDQVMGNEPGLKEPQNSTTKATQFTILPRNSELEDTVRVPLASKNSLGNVDESPDFPNGLPEDLEKAATTLPCLQTSCDENAEFHA